MKNFLMIMLLPIMSFSQNLDIGGVLSAHINSGMALGINLDFEMTENFAIMTEPEFLHRTKENAVLLSILFKFCPNPKLPVGVVVGTCFRYNNKPGLVLGLMYKHKLSDRNIVFVRMTHRHETNVLTRFSPGGHKYTSDFGQEYFSASVGFQGRVF